MKSQEVELKDLLPGFVRTDQGGVVRIAELQPQRYIYLRPRTRVRPAVGRLT